MVPTFEAVVPVPVLPATVVTVSDSEMRVKLAVTLGAVVIDTVHGLVLHPPPLKPANVEPVADVAVSVMLVP